MSTNIINGLRSPGQAVAGKTHSEIAESGGPIIAVKAGHRLYQSRHAKLRVQVTAPPMTTDALGRQSHTRGKVAKFEGNCYQTNDPEIIEHLDRHPEYGLGKMFWDAEEFVAVANEVDIQNQVDRVKRNPELARRIMEALTAPDTAEGDVKLPELGKDVRGRKS